MKRSIGAVLAAVLLSGCSFIFVNKPPPGDGPLELGSCTMSKAAPILDLIGAANYAIPAMLPEESLDDLGLPSGGGARSFWVMGAGALVYSAMTGFGATSECRRRQLMSEQALLDHLRSAGRVVIDVQEKP